MKKGLLISTAIILIVIALVVALGIYKFNFTNDDIYIKTDDKINSLDATSTDQISKTDQSALIKINNFISGQIVQSPLMIEGVAPGSWFFEASFPVKIYNENSQLIGMAIATASAADGSWMTDKLVPFKAELKFDSATSTSGALVLEKDNPSGLPENAAELRLPVRFLPTTEKIKIKVFFSNNKLDPEVSCNKVFPVEREVTETPAIARAALTELLLGVTPLESEAGFMTSLNRGIKIQSLTIKDGVARVDFNAQLEAGSGGSCRVAAITTQIRETLKQFPSVKDVIISIDGNSEDILQP